MRLDTEVLNVTQMRNQEALSCFLAMAAEISKDPRVGLNKPVADWLPWLREEGYIPDGLDDFVISLLNAGSVPQDSRFLHVAYEDALANNLATSRFLILLRKDKPSEFRVFGECLSKKSKEFLEVNSSAGGTMTGSAATFIKHNPIVSAYAIGLVFSFAVGTAIHFSAKKAKSEGITERDVDQDALQDAIDTTIKSNPGAVEQVISRAAANDSIQPRRELRNFEDHPAEFVVDNKADMIHLNQELLNNENVDNFIDLAMRDEDQVLLSAVAKAFVTEIKDAGEIWRYLGANATKELEKNAKALITIVDEDRDSIIDPVTKAIKQYSITRPGSKEAYEAYNNALKRVEECNSEQRKAIKQAYETYVTNADPKKLKPALIAFEESSINSDFKKAIGQGVLIEESAQFDYDMNEIESHELKFTEDVIKSSMIDLEKSADEELVNLAQDLQDLFKKEEEDLINDEEVIIDKLE